MPPLDVPPIVEASSLRVDVGGSCSVDGLSLTSTAERLLVLGAPRALFEAAAALRPAKRGHLKVHGVPPADALRARAAATAPLDPRLPPAWTVREYVTWSSRLSGQAGAASTGLVAEALERFQLAPFAKTRLRAASLAARRGAVLAGALASGAPTILLEDPLPGLPSDTARSFAHVVVRALRDRRTALFAARIPLDSPFALAADEAIVVDGSQVVAQGLPAEIASRESTFVLRMGGDVDAFVDAVRASGVGWLGSDAVAATLASRAPVTVDLGETRTRDLLRLANGANAIVLELRPVARAFA